MELRTQTSLLAAALCFAIAATVLLRVRKRRVHWFFGIFASTVGAWYLSTFFAGVIIGEQVAGAERTAWQLVVERLNLVCAVLLPLSAVPFFRTFLTPDSRRANQLQQGALGLALVMVVAVFTPLYHLPIFAALIFTYVFVLLSAALVMLFRAARTARSRFERARLYYLLVVGALAAVFTLAEYLPYADLDIPPVGTVFILVFLYVLSQSIVRYRLLDLYELAGRLTFLTALSFSLAGILWVLVLLAPGHFFLHSVVAALILFLTFDPVRAKLEDWISQLFLRERHDLERVVGELRTKLAHTLTIEQMTEVVMTGLEGSRRITDAAIYLVDDLGRGYDLVGHASNAQRKPAQRIEIALARSLLDRLRADEAVVLENLERGIDEAHELGEHRQSEVHTEIIQMLEAMHATVCVAIRGADETYGLLCVRDDRLRDAFSPEEVQLLRGLAAQASIAIENSRLYQRLKQRDRLATLGEMAAGLAHEIRNPLGAIKASAQFLAEPTEEANEFLGIIVEEVDRLNRVVSSFLDYARPGAGDPTPTDVNSVVHRTLTLLGKDLEGIEAKLELDEDLPRVRIDAERLRQVLINLAQNAAQAMAGHGTITLRTLDRTYKEVGGEPRRWAEICVSDTGPGIPQKVLANLFVPFVTTKNRGTGLGLAISQRIVNAAGGHIEVRSHEGVGTTFVVRLPAVEDEVLTQSSSAPPALAPSSAGGPNASRAEGPAERGGSGLEETGEVPTSLVTMR